MKDYSNSCLVAFKNHETDAVEWMFLSILDSLATIEVNQWSYVYFIEKNINFWLQVKAAKKHYLENSTISSGIRTFIK